VSRLYKEIERDNYETSEVPKKVTLMEILNNEQIANPVKTGFAMTFFLSFLSADFKKKFCPQNEIKN